VTVPPSTPEQRRSFIQAQTTLATPPLTPEIKLYLATEITPIWEATEATLEANNLPPPYWAFAWPGRPGADALSARSTAMGAGEARARLRGGQRVSPRSARRWRVRKRSRPTRSMDFAIEAILLNAAANQITIDVLRHDLIGRNEGWDVVLAATCATRGRWPIASFPGCGRWRVPASPC
jgi:hypothetical protein